MARGRIKQYRQDGKIFEEYIEYSAVLVGDISGEANILYCLSIDSGTSFDSKLTSVIDVLSPINYQKCDILIWWIGYILNIKKQFPKLTPSAIEQKAKEKAERICSKGKNDFERLSTKDNNEPLTNKTSEFLMDSGKDAEFLESESFLSNLNLVKTAYFEEPKNPTLVSSVNGFIQDFKQEHPGLDDDTCLEFLLQEGTFFPMFMKKHGYSHFVYAGNKLPFIDEICRIISTENDLYHIDWVQAKINEETVKREVLPEKNSHNNSTAAMMSSLSPSPAQEERETFEKLCEKAMQANTPGANISVTLGSLQFQVKTDQKSPKLTTTQEIERLKKHLVTLNKGLAQAKNSQDKEQELEIVGRIKRREARIALLENGKILTKPRSDSESDISISSVDSNEEEHNDKVPSPK